MSYAMSCFERCWNKMKQNQPVGKEFENCDLLHASKEIFDKFCIGHDFRGTLAVDL